MKARVKWNEKKEEFYKEIDGFSKSPLLTWILQAG
jgi:hypothetical protein